MAVLPHEHTEEWNSEDSWVDFVAGLDSLIDSIAAKYTTDMDLRQDAAQNARIELLYIRPEEVRGYEDYTRGSISFDRWQEILRAYCGTVIRNEVLSTLSSHTTGNLYTGRTQVVRTVDEDGKPQRVRKHLPARYVSLDQLVDEAGIQVSDRGEITWKRDNEISHGDEDNESI